MLLNRADTYRVHADFATFTPLPGAVIAESDACTLRLIGNPSQDVELHAAGTISLTGTTTPLSLEFDGEGYEQVGDGAIFEPEATIQVSATGDDVPPFSAELVAPSHAALTSPESFEYFTIDTSSDFVLEWASEGSVGDVELTVFASKEAPSEAFVLTCRFPLGDGVGVVPREVLENLTGALGESAFISEVARTTTEVGPWTVATLASALIDDSNGGVGFPELQ